MLTNYRLTTFIFVTTLIQEQTLRTSELTIEILLVGVMSTTALGLIFLGCGAFSADEQILFSKLAQSYQIFIIPTLLPIIYYIGLSIHFVAYKMSYNFLGIRQQRLRKMDALYKRLNKEGTATHLIPPSYEALRDTTYQYGSSYALKVLSEKLSGVRLARTGILCILLFMVAMIIHGYYISALIISFFWLLYIYHMRELHADYTDRLTRLYHMIVTSDFNSKQSDKSDA